MGVVPSNVLQKNGAGEKPSGDCRLYIDGCVCKAFSILTCSDIVFHLSAELYIVPINIYSCQSSVVRRRHLHGIMK